MKNKKVNRTKNRENFRKSFLIITGIIIGWVILQWPSAKWQNLIHWSERSAESSRLMIWKAAWKIGRDHWWRGIGPGNFQEQYLLYQKYFPPYLEWAAPQPHNIFLAFWLQTGFLGLISFLWLLCLFFKKIRRKIIFYQNEKKLTPVLLALMLYWLIHGMVDTTFWKNDLALMFWLNTMLILF